jgi:hypothetical protein
MNEKAGLKNKAAEIYSWRIFLKVTRGDPMPKDAGEGDEMGLH